MSTHHKNGLVTDNLLTEIQEISRKIGASGDRHGVTPQTQHLWKALMKAERLAMKQGIDNTLVEQVRDAGMLKPS